jgi:hypothetical protein
MPDRYRQHPSTADTLPAGALVVPTVAAWSPDAGDPQVLAWQLPDDGGLVAVAYSTPAALDRAMPGGQPWVAWQPADLDAALSVHGHHRLLVDPTPEDLAAVGGPPSWAITAKEAQ